MSGEGFTGMPDTYNITRGVAAAGLICVLLAAAALAAAGCHRPEMLGERDPLPEGCMAPAVIAWPAAPAGPATRTVALGESVRGQPLAVEIFGTGPRPVLVLGGIHGNEPEGAEVARRLAALLRQDCSVAGGCAVAVMAAANPDGLAVRTRVNARGVDINRNFPAKNWQAGAATPRYASGPCPGSEPETQTLMRAVEMLRPGLILSLHAMARGPCNNYDGPGGKDVADRMAACNGYRVIANIGYPTPGSMGNWAGIDRGIPMVTLELPAGQPGPACWEQNREALLAAIRGAAVPAQ